MCQLSDNFYSAVRALAGDGSIKSRLACAFTDHLAMLAEEDLPDSIRPRFLVLRQAMKMVKPISTEDPVIASVRKMSAAEASRYAASIVAMFSELVRVKATGERVRPRDQVEVQQASPDIEVPRMLRAALN
jgi:hypothetical protein